MVRVPGTNALKQKAIEAAEKQGRDATAEELAQFESESILVMQEKAELAKKTAIGNAYLSKLNVSNIPIKECTFQPEEKIVRFATDVVGDPSIKANMSKNKEVEKKVKLMEEHKLKVVSKVRAYDQSEKIFDRKKGKEKTHFMARNA